MRYYADSAFREEQRLLLSAGMSAACIHDGPLESFIALRLYPTGVAAKRESYLIFFPSYRFMEDVYEQFLAVNEQEAELYDAKRKYE